MPLPSDLGLIGGECPFAKFSLAQGVQFQLGEQLGERSDGLLRPPILCHQGNERVLGHWHLAEAEFMLSTLAKPKASSCCVSWCWVASEQPSVVRYQSSTYSKSSMRRRAY